MRNCGHYRLMISRRMDNDLDAKEMGELSAHIDGCLNCRQYADKFKVLKRLLNGTDGISVKRQLHAKSAVKFSFRKAMIAASCAMVLLIMSGLIIRFTAGYGKTAENPAHIEEPLGYLSFTEEECFIDADIVNRPLNTYFSYLDPEE